MKKIICYCLLSALLLIPFTPADAWSSFRNETGDGNANTTAAQTPVASDRTGAKWQLKFETDAVTAYNSDPVITDDAIYAACKNTLYEINKNGVVLRTFTLAAPINSVCRMSLHENRLFIPLSGGMVQCVDIHAMSSLWTSESFGLQSLTSTFYKKGFLCAGTTNAAGTDGLYYCLSETDGSTQWVYRGEQPCGYYWSGAVSGTDGTNYILFGGDDGILVSHSLAADTVYDTYDLSSCTGSHGKIRAGITYDTQTDAFYTTTNDGYVYQIKMNKDGRFESVSALSLSPDGDGINCTSTPTVFHGRIYVCSYDGTRGQINVIDAATMKMIYSASGTDCHDIKSSPLVCTGYAKNENKNRVYIYFTQNSPPGGIYYIEDDETAVSAQIHTLFLPVGGKQFCLSSVAADTDGTLYYSNDSGTLFAIAEGYAALPPSTPQPDFPAPTPSTPLPSACTPPTYMPPAAASPNSPAPTPAAVKHKKPGKPGKVKYRTKKRKNNRYRVTFTWNKGKNSDFTHITIQGKTLSGKKYKRNLNTFRKTITAALKNGTYTVRFYGCCTATSNTPAAVRIRDGSYTGAKKSGAATLRLRLH